MFVATLNAVPISFAHRRAFVSKQPEGTIFIGNIYFRYSKIYILDILKYIF
jgi:hypothetical protein